MVNSDTLGSAFAVKYAKALPEVFVRAPGRVNLIGEHTDYNDGYVLPIGTKQALYVAARGRRDGRIRAYSRAFDETAEWSIGEEIPKDTPAWANYLKGVTALLRNEGVSLTGADLLVESDVPVGGGVSSSAALEVGVALVFLTLANASLEPMRLAALCQRAENEYAGAPCGIMDQTASIHAKKGHAMLIDCRTRRVEQVPLRLADAAIVLIDTQVKHSIGGGEYGIRRRQCAEALAALRSKDDRIGALRDVRPEDLETAMGCMNATTARRTRHVVTECQRVLDAVACLRSGSLVAFGALMYASHESLRDDYEVSCAELDALVEICRDVDGVYGARMTGGGFGGCVVVLSERRAVGPLQARIERDYSGTFEKPAVLYTTEPDDGARAWRR